VAFTADGQSIFAQGKVYDVHTGEQKAKVANPEYPGFVGISADGKTAYVLSGNRVLVFDPATWAPRQTFTSCVNEPYSIGISPDGSIIALGAFGRPLTICLLDANTGQVLRTFDAPANTFGLVFSPDSRVLAAGACDTTTHLYDVATGVELKAMKFPGTPHCVNDIAFSPDGRYLLAAGTEDKLWLWDVQTGEKVREFIGHTGVIWGAAISRDGRYAVSGGADGTARLWDIATGKEVRRFAGHAGIVWEVAISPDAKLVATTSNDGTVKFWNTNLDDLKAAVCGVMSRDLTEAERRRYNITDTGPTCPNLPPAAAAQP
jgi:WD40 repeat protein